MKKRNVFDNKNVNFKYILSLTKDGEEIVLKENPIEQHTELLARLEEFSKSESYTPYDMLEYFNNNYQVVNCAISCMLPSFYTSSDVTGHDYISFNPYDTTIVTREMLDTWMKGNVSIEELKKKLYDKLKGIILTTEYKRTADALTKNQNTLFFSWDKHGFEVKHYDIDEDFAIEVKTNFGYGNASYMGFILTYKNVLILPFSEITKHYSIPLSYNSSVPFSYFTEWTYSVPPDRENWTKLLEAARDTIDRVKRSKRTYIEEQIRAYYHGLKAIVEGDSTIMSQYESEMYQEMKDSIKIFPELAMRYFIAEKLRESEVLLPYLQPLKDFPEANKLMRYISSRLPEIKKLLDCLQNEISAMIDPLEFLESNLETELKILASTNFQFNLHYQIRAVDPEGFDIYLENFLQNHPEVEFPPKPERKRLTSLRFLGRKVEDAINTFKSSKEGTIVSPLINLSFNS